MTSAERPPRRAFRETLTRDIHPLLVAVYPVVFLHAANPGQSPFPWALAGALAVGALALSVGLGWLTGHRTRAALMVSAALVLAYSYGHVFDLLEDALGPARVAGIELVRHRHLLALYALAAVAAAALVVRTRSSLTGVAHVLTLVLAIALALSASRIALFELEARRLLARAGQLSSDGASRPTGTPSGASLPSIYYILLDGRASSSVLARYFDHSDAEFTGYLRQAGFSIAERSHTNYAMTFLSLASSLNMEYLDGLRDQVGADSTDETLARWMIANNRLIRVLKASGYRIVNVSSGWGPTNWMPTADENLNAGSPFAEFHDVLLQTTILRPFRIGQLRDSARQRVLRSLDGLLEATRRPRPTFVFAHVLAPHPPFVFGRRGEPVATPRMELFGEAWKRKTDYVNQLTYIDRRVREVVERILAASDIPPIIVIQSDHGPASSGDLSRPTEHFLRERMPIFNAFHLPGPSRPAVPADITPVNSFRLVLNAYLGTRFPLLPDQVYFSRPERPYRFERVDAVLARP